MRKSKLEPSEATWRGGRSKVGTPGLSAAGSGGIQAGAEELISSFQMLLPQIQRVLSKAGIGGVTKGRGGGMKTLPHHGNFSWIGFPQ